MRFLSRWVEPIYALLRVVAGLLFAFHGAQKLFGAFGGQTAGEPLMILAGVIELGGGLLIALGLLTSIAAFIASGEMAVAYFMAHAPQGPWPIQNGGELAALTASSSCTSRRTEEGPIASTGASAARQAVAAAREEPPTALRPSCKRLQGAISTGGTRRPPAS